MSRKYKDVLQLGGSHQYRVSRGGCRIRETCREFARWREGPRTGSWFSLLEAVTTSNTSLVVYPA